MTLQIYNTLTRRKEPFIPAKPGGPVLIYNCGPTVYDHFHIGNARNFVVMDVARRYLERTYEVKFVQNLTDVDDKIIRRANEEKDRFGEGLAGFNAVREAYIAAYFEDAGKLRVRRATLHPCATEFIAEMIALMQTLTSKGFAYANENGVYFRVRRFAEYGKLSGRNVDDMLSGARVDVAEHKEDPLDFALWKAAKPGEPSWPSPWGEGRPGWHLECSAMAMNLLGETIDIHSGGADLAFPHHENEIAQSECASGHPFARFWMHNGFLNIDGEKMSKSIGNILKIDQVLERYPVEAVRFFLLSAHYRHPLDYNAGALEEATAATRRINEGIETAEKILALASPDAAADPSIAPVFKARFEEAMDDDFNTPRALALLHELVTAMHEELRKRPPDYSKLKGYIETAHELRSFFDLEPAIDPAAEAALVEALIALDTEAEAWAREHSVDLAELPGDAPMDKAAILERLIALRKIARKQKAFPLADLIRSKLTPLGLALEDHPQGTIWKVAAKP